MVGLHETWLNDEHTELLVQFSAYDGGYNKCVAVKFSQNGDDVYGQVAWIDYTNWGNSSGDARLRDFNTNPGNMKHGTGSVYQVNSLYACTKKTYVSSFDIKRMVVKSNYKVEDEPCVFNGTYIPDIHDDAAYYSASGDGLRNFALCWENTPLKTIDISTLTATMGETKKSINRKDNCPAYFPKWAEDGSFVDVQFQVDDDGYNKVHRIRLMQIGDDIYALSICRYYTNTSTAAAGTRDFVENPASAIFGGDTYSISRLKASFFKYGFLRGTTITLR